MLCIGDMCVPRGKRLTINLPVANLPTYTQLTMPIRVVSGKEDGPVLFVSAAIHGDEINGVEIIHRLLKLPQLKKIKGTLIAVPIVNVYGFMQHTRYLPDRRDLNRSFPGKEKGPMTSRLAHLFMTEIVSKCTHGIDLHTGSNHRANLPQIRASFNLEQTRELALSFGAPVVIESSLREGSLRHAVEEFKIPLLLYEAGEALRFDETSISIGVRGILSVMNKIGMISEEQEVSEPLLVSSSSWIRSPESGILRNQVKLGAHVKKGDVIATIGDSFHETEAPVVTHRSGIIIGSTYMPLVHEGEALFHIAPIKSKEAETIRENFQEDIEWDWNYDALEPPGSNYNI